MMPVAELMDRREIAEQKSLNMTREISFRLGRMSGVMDSLHTCGSPLQYPWPPNPNCHACRVRIDQFVEREHLQMPFLLFGWDVIVEHFWELLERMSQQAAARRNMGDGI